MLYALFLFLSTICAVEPLNETEIQASYDKSLSGEPHIIWEDVGGQFLNATRNGQSLKLKDILAIQSGDMTLLQEKYIGVVVFIGFTAFSSFLFCFLAPILACCCGCCKNRSKFTSSHIKRYEIGTYIMVITSLVLLICVGIMTVMSTGSLNTSADTLVVSVGSVYSGALGFVNDTSTSFITILDEMELYAEQKINNISTFTINQVINSTKTDLKVLSLNLSTEFNNSDKFIGELSYRIVELNNIITRVKTEFVYESNNFTSISNNLNALGSSNQFADSYEYNAKSNPFPSRQFDPFNPNLFPSDLIASAQSLNNSKGAFNQSSSDALVKMQEHLDTLSNTLLTTFEKIKEMLKSGKESLKNKLSSNVETLQQTADEYGSTLQNDIISNRSYIPYFFYSVIAIMSYLVILFGAIIFCIAAKKRKLGMSCASLFFLFAGISLFFSLIVYFLAFSLTESCDQLQSNFEIIPDKSVSAMSAVAFSAINLCASGKSFDQVLLDPSIKPTLLKISPNYADYLNASYQIDVLMESINLNEFTSPLNFQLSDVFDYNSITNSTTQLYQQSFSNVDSVISTIPPSGINASIASDLASVLRAAIPNLNNTNLYNYIDPLPFTVLQEQFCVDDFLNKTEQQAKQCDNLKTNIDATNLLFPVMKTKANDTSDKAKELKVLMQHIADIIETSFDRFDNTTSTGKNAVKYQVDQIPIELKVKVLQQFEYLKQQVTCKAMGQVLSMMENEICLELR